MSTAGRCGATVTTAVHIVGIAGRFISGLTNMLREGSDSGSASRPRRGGSRRGAPVGPRPAPSGERPASVRARRYHAGMSTRQALGPATVWVVRNVRGGPYDFSRDMREQEQWKEHAAFMNALVDDGVVLIGGPLEGGLEVILVCSAPTEDALRRRLAEDPWVHSGMLTAKSVERMTVALSPAAVDELLARGAPPA